jgi:type II secretory pathway pseudopilin PulG
VRVKWPSWLPRVLFESALIVFSVLLALALDEWRDERATAARAREAVAAITAELEANRKVAERARDYHRGIHAKLNELVAKKQLPGPEIYMAGMFNPARLLETAWTAARDAGAIDAMPYPVVLKLSRVYEWQAVYKNLGSQIVTDLYADLRRRGVEPVMRDGYTGFIILTADFVGREEDLVARYDDALATLASLTQ